MASPEELPPLEPPADAVRQSAEEILSRPEFEQPAPTLWDRIQQAINDAIEALVDSVFGAGRNGVVALLVLALVAAAIGFLIFRLVRSSGTFQRDEARSGVSIEPLRPASDWDAMARAHAEAGEWRDAIRCRYRALVARLAAADVVDEIPGRTAGEYRLEVRSRRPEAAEPFGGATDLFERVWYGAGDATAEGEAVLVERAGETLERARS